MDNDSLKLSARDEKDLQVIAAVLQDSIVPCCDMLYRPADKCFVMVLHRFRWEEGTQQAEKADPPAYERVHCLLEVDGVEGVRMRGVEGAVAGGMMELLTILLDDGALVLVFAGGAQVRLRLGSWLLRIKDIGLPWPTTHQPAHSA